MFEHRDMRACFADSAFPVLGRVTLSAGVTGLAEGEDADLLVGRAQAALTFAGMVGDTCQASSDADRRERVAVLQ